MSKQLGDNVKRWIGEIASPLVLYVDKNVQDEGKKELEELIEKANRVDELEKGIQEGLIVENTEEGIKNHKELQRLAEIGKMYTMGFDKGLEIKYCNGYPWINGGELLEDWYRKELQNV